MSDDLTERIRTVLNKPPPWEELQVRRRTYRITTGEADDYATVTGVFLVSDGYGGLSNVMYESTGDFSIELVEDELLFRTDSTPGGGRR